MENVCVRGHTQSLVACSMKEGEGLGDLIMIVL